MKKLSLLLLIFLSSVGMMLAQRMVSGTITDTGGEALIGANVLVNGSDAGTITDVFGKYELNVPDGFNTLSVSYTGYTTKEIELGASNIMDIVMAEGVLLGDVVVTALGMKRSEKSIGYAAQSVGGEELTTARESNIVNSLNGKIAGVQITNSSGAVGSSSRILLRGASSITGNNEPLFVIDGIPLNNVNYGEATSGGGFDLPGGVADLNPDDIESVNVLKGPNAAALYGVRAANGVILITTKSGKAGKNLGITFNSSVMMSNPLLLPGYQNSYGQGGSDKTFEWKDGTNGDGGVDESWGPALDIGLNFKQWDAYKNNGEATPWISHPNNIKDFYETGLKTDNNLSFSGGTDNLGFRLSMGHSNEKGIVPNTDYSKYNISGNSSIKIADKLTAGINVSYVKGKSGNLPYGGYDNENPVQQMIWSGRNVDFSALRDYENLPGAPAGTAAEGTPLNWNTVFQNNPFWVLNNNLNKLNKDRIIGGVNLTYDFSDNFSVTAKSGTDYFSSLVTSEKAKGSNNAPEGSYKETARLFNEINNSLIFSYNTEITSDFDFSTTLGGNRMNSKYRRVYGEAPQLELPGLYTLANLKSGATAISTSRTTNSAINSVFGTAQVGWKNALYLEFTGRNDWASVLPTDNNSFFYPSITMSAVVTELMNMNKDILSFLKVRGGWAKVGGFGALTPYQLNQTYGFREEAFGSTPLLFNPLTLKNPNIKPETTAGIEFGIDSRFFNNKLRFDFTYYDQTSSDLIVPAEISAASGYTKAWQNVGEMRNKGVEIQLGSTLYETKDFSFDMDVNFAKNDNQVVSLGGLDALILGGQWNVDLQAREGMPYGVLVGPAFVKDDAGNVVHKNGLPIIDSENQILGDIQPDWTGGVSFDVRYKGLSLNTIIDTKQGGDIYTMTTTWGRYAGVLSETLKGRETGIVGDGVMINGDGNYVPNNVVVTSESYNKAAFSNSVAESSVFDASYVKWRQLMLTYELPKSMLGKKLFKGVSISLIGRNLAILSKNVPHIDPESSFSSANGDQGQEFGQIPSVRNIGFNIRFNL